MELTTFDVVPEEKDLWERMLGGINEKYVGVEIGCLYGDSAKVILGCSPYITLISIDPFIPDSIEVSLIGSEEISREKNKEFGTRFQLINNYSWNVVQSFKDNSLDFLFIDGDHRFHSVLVDYTSWEPKIKKGGLLFIHDSRMYRPNNPSNFHEGPSLVNTKVILPNENLWKLEDEAFTLTCVRKLI